MTSSEFKAVFQEHKMRVFYYCRKIIRHKQDAEDLTADVFSCVWRVVDTIRPDTIQALLMTTAKNKCIDYLRSKGRHEKATEQIDIPTETEIEIQYEVMEQIMEIIEKLPPKQKQFIKLKYIEGVEPRTVSDILRINKSTIRNHMFIALAKIRTELKKRGINHR